MGEILREFDFADFESLTKAAYVLLRVRRVDSANLFWDTHNRMIWSTNRMWVLLGH